MKIKVRPANQFDISAISEIALTCFPSDYTSNVHNNHLETAKKWIERHIELKPFGLVVAAEYEGQIIGFLVYVLLGGLSGIVHIEQIAVDPVFQHKGIGSSMLHKGENILIDFLKSEFGIPLKKLILTTSTKKTLVNNFYIKNGYTHVSSLGNLFFDEEESLYIKSL